MVLGVSYSRVLYDNINSMILYFKHIIHIDDLPLNGHPPSICTIVACAFKRKSSAARFALHLNRRNASFERESPQHWIDRANHNRRPACANVSLYTISLSIGRLISSEGVRLLRNSKPYVKTIQRKSLRAVF